MGLLKKLNAHLKAMHSACEAFAEDIGGFGMENGIDRVILHHSLTKDSGTVSWQAIRRYHVIEMRWAGIGYHYGIELVNDEYEILVGRQLNKPGAHTMGQNNNSVGICFVGNFDETDVPAGQWEKGLDLVRSLMAVFGLERTDVYGHRDFADKSCPGRRFDLARFKSEL